MINETFSPEKYLRTLTRRRKVKDSRGNDTWVEETHVYLDVKYRILWFRQVYPEGYIETTELATNEQFARIEATVYDRDPSDGGKRLAKSRRQVMANDFRNYVEKAETQAIGRALALAGFGTQFCDDLDDSETVADSPVSGNGKKSRNSNGAGKQINGSTLNGNHQAASTAKSPVNVGSETRNVALLYKAAAQKGLSREETDLIVLYKYQKDNASQLNDDEFSEMLNGIQKTPAERLTDFAARLRVSMEEEGVA